MPNNFSRLKPALLHGLCCGAFCVGSLVFQTITSNPAVGQDALNALDDANKPGDAAEQPPAQQQQAQQQEALKKMNDMLYKELDTLVPGEQAEGSPAAESLHAAVDAVMNRKADMAFVILEQAVTSNPEFPPAELLMAGLSFAAKDQRNGLQYLRKAAIKNPEHPAVYAAYGRMASGTNRSVDAKVHFEKLFNLLSDVKDEAALQHYQNEYLEGMSQAAAQLEDFKLSRELAGQLLERKPGNTNALQLLAKVAFEEGNLSEAATNLAKIREKNPETRAPEALIGTWFVQKNQPEKAVAWYNKLPAAYPNDASVQLEYAVWALTQEKVEAAAEAIAKAEAIDAPTLATRNLKGKIAFFQRKYDDAVEIYKALHEEFPANSEVSNMYVLSMIESSSAANKALANELANANLQKKPNNRILLATLGYVRLKTLGVNEQLTSIFAKVNQTRDRRTPEVDYFLASFLKEAGDTQNALKVLQQASQFSGLFLYRKQADQMRQALPIIAPTP